MRKRNSREWWLVLGGAVLAAVIIALTHPRGAIISFDEGFHGGGALFFQELARFALGLTHHTPHYIEGEFANGITLYPPLWTGLAALLGFVFGASTAIYRATTLIFYVVGIVMTYGFSRAVAKNHQVGLIAALIFASVPMIVIYSHLMMLEVPLLVASMAMILGFFLYTEGLLPRKGRVIALLTLVFGLAPLAKLPELPVAWLIIIGYTITSSLLFWRQRFYRRFLKPELLLFLVISFIPLWLYITGVKHYLHVDMIDFFVGQSNEGSHPGMSPLVYLLSLSWSHRDFYLRDFRHMPILSLIWTISLFGYAAWKRTPLGLLLVIWAVGVYAAFSGVSPQVPQYIMPLYAPLALATAFFVFDLTRSLPVPHTKQVLAGATFLIVILQLFSLSKSEGYGWRTKITGQEQAAQWITDHAEDGERIVTWHDGTFYALRLAGLEKRLQIMHGGPGICQQGLRDSTEWATEINEPPLAEPQNDAVLKQAPWQEVKQFGTGTAGTILYQNTGLHWPATIEAETHDATRTLQDSSASAGQALHIRDTDNQPALWGCLRYLPFGNTTLTIRLKTLSLPKGTNDNEDILRIEYGSYPQDEYTSTTLKARDLRQSSDYHDYTMHLTHAHMDRPGEFRLFVFREANLALDKITITPQNRD